MVSAWLRLTLLSSIHFLVFEAARPVTDAAESKAAALRPDGALVRQHPSKSASSSLVEARGPQADSFNFGAYDDKPNQKAAAGSTEAVLAPGRASNDDEQASPSAASDSMLARSGASNDDEHATGSTASHHDEHSQDGADDEPSDLSFVAHALASAKTTSSKANAPVNVASAMPLSDSQATGPEAVSAATNNAVSVAASPDAGGVVLETDTASSSGQEAQTEPDSQDEAEAQSESVASSGSKKIITDEMVPTTEEIMKKDLFKNTMGESTGLNRAMESADQKIHEVDKSVDKLGSAMETYDKSIQGLGSEFGQLTKTAQGMHSSLLGELQAREAIRMCAFENIERMQRGEKALPCSKETAPADGDYTLKTADPVPAGRSNIGDLMAGSMSPPSEHEEALPEEGLAGGSLAGGSLALPATVDAPADGFAPAVATPVSEGSAPADATPVSEGASASEGAANNDLAPDAAPAVSAGQEAANHDDLTPAAASGVSASQEAASIDLASAPGTIRGATSNDLASVSQRVANDDLAPAAASGVSATKGAANNDLAPATATGPSAAASGEEPNA